MLSKTMDIYENNTKENKKEFNYFDIINKLQKEQKPFKMSDRIIIETGFKNSNNNVLYFGQIDKIKNFNFSY